jgi:hypothetical protein
MDKLEITAEARRLGTFDISIEPDLDCCTLFVPPHPATRLGADAVRAVEARLDVARLVRAGVEGAACETFYWPMAETPGVGSPTEGRDAVRAATTGGASAERESRQDRTTGDPSH